MSDHPLIDQIEAEIDNQINAAADIGYNGDHNDVDPADIDVRDPEAYGYDGEPLESAVMHALFDGTHFEAWQKAFEHIGGPECDYCELIEWFDKFCDVCGFYYVDSDNVFYDPSWIEDIYNAYMGYDHCLSDLAARCEAHSRY